MVWDNSFVFDDDQGFLEWAKSSSHADGWSGSQTIKLVSRSGGTTERCSRSLKSTNSSTMSALGRGHGILPVHLARSNSSSTHIRRRELLVPLLAQGLIRPVRRAGLNIPYLWLQLIPKWKGWARHALSLAYDNLLAIHLAQRLYNILDPGLASFLQRLVIQFLFLEQIILTR